MKSSIKDIGAVKLLVQDKRLAIALEAFLKDEGITFGNLKRTLDLPSNELCYHLKRMVDGRILRKARTLECTRVSEDKAALGNLKSTSGNWLYSYQLTNTGRRVLDKLGVQDSKVAKQVLEELKGENYSLL